MDQELRKLSRAAVGKERWVPGGMSKDQLEAASPVSLLPLHGHRGPAGDAAPFGPELVPGTPGWALQKQTETAGMGDRRGHVFMGDQSLQKEEEGGTAGDVNQTQPPQSHSQPWGRVPERRIAHHPALPGSCRSVTGRPRPQDSCDFRPAAL